MIAGLREREKKDEDSKYGERNNKKKNYSYEILVNTRYLRSIHNYMYTSYKYYYCNNSRYRRHLV